MNVKDVEVGLLDCFRPRRAEYLFSVVAGRANGARRLRRFRVPPTTGNYVFWIASDDNSTLFLSTDDTAARKRVIASVPGATASREWAKYAQQRFWITQATTGI